MVAAEAKDKRAIPWNGTGTLSGTDDTLQFTTDAGSKLEALINNTITCDLITITQPAHKGKGKASHWQKIQHHEPPPFDLKVLTGTYLGDGEKNIFLPVSVELMETDASSTDSANDVQRSLVVVGGNGQFTFGQTAKTILNASSQSNGTVALLVVDSASGSLKPAAVIKVGNRVDAVSVRADGILAVVGDFGAALLKLSAAFWGDNSDQPDVSVVWHDDFALVQRGSCGLCCDGQNRCRISVSKANAPDQATAPSVAVGIPVVGRSAIVTYGATGARLGERTTRHGHFITDVEMIDSPEQPNTVRHHQPTSLVG